jgi:hypothetical protein
MTVASWQRLSTHRASATTKKQKTALCACLCVLLLAGSSVQAQKPVYFDYPLAAGKEQHVLWDKIPQNMAFQLELRGRTEGQTSYNLVSGNDHTYELTRVRGSMEYRPTAVLTGYLQFQDTHALGLPIPSVASNMRDQFDLFAGYLNIHFEKVQLIVGRQPLTFGSQRLVGVSDWTNTGRSWDGFDAHFGQKTRVELFSTSVVQVHPTSLDKHGAGLTFHGAVATLGALDPHLEVQLFEYIRALPHVLSQQGVPGAELESTFGTEMSGTEKSGLDFDILAALQRGSYSANSIHAGAAYAKVGYLVRDKPWKPRLVGEYDYATGNPHRNPARVSTFDQLYPSNHYAFGLVDLLGFQNITQSQAGIDITPVSNLTVRTQGELLKVANRQDGVYNSSGLTLIKAPPGGFASSRIGQEFDVSSTYVLHTYILIEAGVGHLFPGPVMTGNGKASPLTLGYLQLTYRFKVDQH